MEIDAVILAAGAGRRMKKPEIPKALVQVGNKPMICYSIDALYACGVKKIYIVKYYLDAFEEIDEMYKETDLVFQYINDYKRKGSLYSFSLLQRYVKRQFICVDCDLFIVPELFEKMIKIGLKKIKEDKPDGIMAYVYNPSKEDSNMLLIENECVVRFLKNGNQLCKRGGYVYLWDKSIFEKIEDYLLEECYSLSKYYDYFVQTHRVGIMEIEDIWDIDNEADVIYTNLFLGRLTS